MPDLSSHETPEARLAALTDHLATFFGGPYSIGEYTDTVTNRTLEVFETAPSTESGVVLASTLGLSEIASKVRPDPNPVRIELLGISDTAKNMHEFLPRILASCAFMMRASDAAFAPGIICQNVFGHIRSRIEHVLLVPQNIWADFDPFMFPDRDIRWLVMVPITERERRYATTYGVDKLYDQLVTKKVRVSDLRRKPVV